MEFCKMNGAGNDFIVINNIEEKINHDHFPLIAKTLCHRHLSIGADGLMVETAPEVAIKYGSLIAVIVDFLIIAFSVFCMVKLINSMKEKAEALKKKEEEEAAPPADPEPSAEEKLLTEIRDLLKNK